MNTLNVLLNFWLELKTCLLIFVKRKQLDIHKASCAPRVPFLCAPFKEHGWINVTVNSCRWKKICIVFAFFYLKLQCQLSEQWRSYTVQHWHSWMYLLKVALNHQLRNVQKLITISWNLQNTSVTDSLPAELKSFHQLCLVGAFWYHSGLNITFF